MDESNNNNFKELINKLQEKLSYGEMNGGSIIITIILLITFIYIFFKFYVEANLGYLKNKWDDIKCNPLYMPFAGDIHKPTNKTKSEFTEENFTFCIQDVLESIAAVTFNPINTATDAITSIFTGFYNTLNGFRDMFDYLRTAIAQIFAKIYAQILILLIPFQQTFVSLKDSMNKASAVMMVAMLSLIGVYYTIGSFASLIMQYTVMIIIVLFITAFIVYWTPFVGPGLSAVIRTVAEFLMIRLAITNAIYGDGFTSGSSGIPPASDDNIDVPTQSSVNDSINESFTTIRQSNNKQNPKMRKQRKHKINKQNNIEDMLRETPENKKNNNTQINTYPVGHEQESPPENIKPYSHEPFDACFNENTLIKIWKQDKKKIKFIEIGDRLSDGSYVTGFFKSSGYTHEYYSLNNIIVTGNHKVLHNDKWIPVKEHPSCVFLPNFHCEFVYCLTTTSKKIQIGSLIFCDWDELDEYDMMELRIKMMKYTITPLAPRSVHKYLDGGFHENTMIELEDGRSLPIVDICVNDVLRFGEVVLGVVVLDANQLFSIKEFTINNKKIIGGYNLLYEESDLGITKMIRTIDLDSTNSREYPEKNNLGVVYHLITDKSTFYINGVKFHDYNASIEWLLDKDNKKILQNILKNL